MTLSPAAQGQLSEQDSKEKTAMMRTSLIAITALGLLVATSRAGLIVRYDFNGNALDSSGSGNHGTIIGSPAFVAGQTDQAIAFNNPAGQVLATQYVSLPNSANILGLQNSSFTIALLYRSTDATMNNGALFGQTRQTSVHFTYNAGGVPGSYAQLEDASGRLLTTQPDAISDPRSITTDGQWHWAIAVLDRDAMVFRYYVDANLIATKSFTQFGPVSFSDLDIGRISGFATFGARQTSVDEFRLYSHALSSDEVNQLVTGVPEPATLTSLAIGVAVLSGYARRRKTYGISE
jgi:hypothetical protein